jgi:hypothetical protein
MDNKMGLRPLFSNHHKIPKLAGSGAEILSKRASFSASANDNLLISGNIYNDVFHGVVLLRFDVYIITL